MRAPVNSKRVGYYVSVALVIVLFAAIRFRLRDMPLERDEGEYAYAGQLILQGIPPYTLAYNMKLPGTYAGYAVILAALGQTPAAIHLGVLLINAATTLLVYLLGARLFGRLAGAVACACYALLSTGPSVMGLAGHATHFVMLPAAGGVLLALKAMDAPRPHALFWSGLLVGLAFVMKQPGVVFVLFVGAWIAAHEWRRAVFDWRRLAIREGVFAAGALVPFAITCAVLFASGAFGRFWFWTFAYAREYASELSLSDGLAQFGARFPAVVGPALLIWITAGVGLTAILWYPPARARAGFLIGFAIASFLAVCPGLYFREHYFIVLLPAVALLAGVAVAAVADLVRPVARGLGAIPVLVFGLVFTYSVWQQRTVLFDADPLAASRILYGVNPFPESMRIAEYLKDHAASGSTVAVLGSEPQIYFYSGLHSATGYIYTYGLTEVQPYAERMQREMIADIETRRPEYMVLVALPTSWLVQPGSAQVLSAWMPSYIRTWYDLDGVVDILSNQRTEYRWGADARTYQPRSQYTISILKRK